MENQGELIRGNGTASVQGKVNGQDADADMANYGAHRTGIKPEEVVSYYNKWAQNGTYEKDLCPDRYRGPAYAAEYLRRYLPVNVANGNGKVLDVAAGTGLLGVKLAEAGYKIIDGIDPSSGMLGKAKETHVYRNLSVGMICDIPTQLQDDMYDGLAVAGGMGEGHIPTIGLREMARLVKPGGYVVIMMREAYLTSVPDYHNRLEPFMKHLEQQGIWDIAERTVVPRYSFDNNGVVFVLKVKVNGCPKVDISCIENGL